MRIAIGSDHAGFKLRQIVAQHLTQKQIEVSDLGCETTDSVDYPHFAERVGNQVAAGEVNFGVLVCGTGLGMSMAANRIPGVVAALCTNAFMASMSRAHNNANVLCLGEQVVGQGLALSIVDAFLSGRFEGGRHARRVEQLANLEKRKKDADTPC